MSKPIPILRASEINSYLFCQRAWWYRRQNIPPINEADLEAGLQLHSTHSRAVRSAIWLRILGTIMLLLATLLIFYSIFLQ